MKIKYKIAYGLPLSDSSNHWVKTLTDCNHMIANYFYWCRTTWLRLCYTQYFPQFL